MPSSSIRSKDGLGEAIHSAGINSLDFGLAITLVSLQTIGSGKRGIASLTVFGQVLDVTEVTTVQVESESGLALYVSIECQWGGGPAPHFHLP